MGYSNFVFYFFKIKLSKYIQLFVFRKKKKKLFFYVVIGLAFLLKSQASEKRKILRYRSSHRQIHLLQREQTFIVLVSSRHKFRGIFSIFHQPFQSSFRKRLQFNNFSSVVVPWLLIGDHPPVDVEVSTVQRWDDSLFVIISEILAIFPFLHKIFNLQGEKLAFRSSQNPNCNSQMGNSIRSTCS